jgi:hypothetical protein
MDDFKTHTPVPASEAKGGPILDSRFMYSHKVYLVLSIPSVSRYGSKAI